MLYTRKVRKIVFLCLILLTAAFLRFYQLGNIAPSLTWDEVAWGYNAYSLGIDGRDEFGRFLPVDYLESFGDFKPPMYAYLDILPIKYLGLNEFAVRFPSALFGVLTVLVTYFLTKSIFSPNSQSENRNLKLTQEYNKENTKKSLEIGNWKLDIPIVAAALLAISPWHIMLSRAAFEANVATFFLSCGVWLFLEAVKGKPYTLILSAISFVCSLYTFNTPRIVAPILILILAIGYRKQLFIIKKQTIMAVIVGLILVLPIIPFLLSPQAKLRYQEVNIFSDISVIKRTNQEIANDNYAWWSKIIHNRRFYYGIEYAKHYLDNLSPLFLFIKGDGNPKFSPQNVGQMYLYELPFFITGIIFLIRKKQGSWWFVPLWILVGIIPAATARETPHALRIETTLPMFQVLVAYGIINTYLFIKKYKTYSKLFAISYLPLAIIYSLFTLFNIVNFVQNYFIHYAKEYSREWQYGYKDAVLYMNEVDKKYSGIYLTQELGRPYIYTLFYKSYSPELFRRDADIQRSPFGFVTINRVGKYYFNKNDLNKTADKNILYIDSLGNVPEKANILKRFNALDGSGVFVAYTM